MNKTFFLGVLGKRARKNYLKVPVEVRQEIENFYVDDSNSMLCSGVKECITIKEPEKSPKKIQKRLILYDLKDLYHKWINETDVNSIPCLAFFTRLKPAQCFFAGDPGTHNVCVCAVHQNLKLKLAAVRPDLNYKEVIESVVCSIDNRNCMLNNCSNCPRLESMRAFLSVSINIADTKITKYLQWSKDDGSGSLKRITLDEFSEPFNVVFESLINNFLSMLTHHYIAYAQSDYYALCREQVEQDTGILTMDFAENYAFIAQNSTQGHYFNNTHATLFTLVLYYKDEDSDQVKKNSFCVISDSTTHQAYSVNELLKPVIAEIKEKYPWIRKLNYFSDGAPTQFKNK